MALAKEYKCRTCGKGGFSSPGVIRRHKVDAHGAPATNKRKVKASKPDPTDQEMALIAVCADAFLNAETDRDADFRALEYLNNRFGPKAYEGVDDKAPAE